MRAFVKLDKMPLDCVHEHAALRSHFHFEAPQGLTRRSARYLSLGIVPRAVTGALEAAIGLLDRAAQVGTDEA